MSRVFEYIIITENRDIHKAEGVSHADALANFSLEPQTTSGFHPGEYQVGSGEEFLVVGPTQANPNDLAAKSLIACRKVAFEFRTKEAIERDAKMADKVRPLLGRNVRITLTEQGQKMRVPAYTEDELTGVPGENPRGVRLNGRTIPYRFIEAITPFN